MQVAYISGPYRADTIHGIVENIRRAEAYAIKYWQLGFAVICPHKNTSMLDGLMESDDWIQGDLVILRRCDVCVMMPGWKNSQGATWEHDCAQRMGMEIIYEK